MWGFLIFAKDKTKRWYVSKADRPLRENSRENNEKKNKKSRKNEVSAER